MYGRPKEERRDLKDFGAPGITLIGFRPRASLQLHHNIKHAMYLRPDEEVMSGSTACTLALVVKMIERDVIAQVSVVMRKGAERRFAMLLPNSEPATDGGGFHMIWMPYEDDLRSLNLPVLAEPSAEAVQAAKHVVDDLRIQDFDSKAYKNPALQQHFINLEVMALEEETKPDVKDDLVPAPPSSSTRVARQHCLDFREAALGADWDDVMAAPPPSKRKAAAAVTGAEKADIEAMDWTDLVMTGEIAALTMATLKGYLKLHSLPLSGKKQDLVDRVSTHVQAAAPPQPQRQGDTPDTLTLGGGGGGGAGGRGAVAGGDDGGDDHGAQEEEPELSWSYEGGRCGWTQASHVACSC